MSSSWSSCASWCSLILLRIIILRRHESWRKKILLDFYCIAVAASSKFSSFIPAALSGRRKILAHGHCPRDKSTKARTRFRPPSVNLPKKPVSRSTATFALLDPVKQSGGKIVHAWAIEGDCDPAQLRSNLFSMEWPPKSGKTQEFPEVDRGAWFNLPEARKRILAAQIGFIEQLVALRDIVKKSEPSAP